MLSEPWLQAVETVPTGKQFYLQRGALAEEILTDGIPEWPAVVVSRTDGGNKGRPLVFLTVDRDGNLQDVPVSPKQFSCLSDAQPGTPLSVKVEERESRLRVLSARPREGNSWDVYPERPAVISNLNRQKGITAVLLSAREVCLLHHDRFPEFSRVEAGSVLRVKVRKDSRRDVLIPLAARVVDATPPRGLCRQFAEPLRTHPSGLFGFAGADIYIPGPMIESRGCADGEEVSGVAVCEWDKRKGCESWRAIRVA